MKIYFLFFLTLLVTQSSLGQTGVYLKYDGYSEMTIYPDGTFEVLDAIKDETAYGTWQSKNKGSSIVFRMRGQTMDLKIRGRDLYLGNTFKWRFVSRIE